MGDPSFFIETPRLYISHWNPDSQKHCAFLVRLYSSVTFRASFGDRQVRTEDDARAVLKNRFVAHFERHGYSGMLISLKATSLEEAEPIGGVSLMLHGEHKLPDVGFGLLDEEQGKGYATEAARALVHYAKTTLGLPHVLAFCSPTNERSRRAIERLSFVAFGVKQLQAFPGHDALVFASEGVRDFAELEKYNVCCRQQEGVQASS